MVLTGVMQCKDQYELDYTMSRLKCVREAIITSHELTICVDYSPSDTDSSFDEEEAIARLSDIIESVEIHGLSVAY